MNQLTIPDKSYIYLKIFGFDSSHCKTHLMIVLFKQYTPKHMIVFKQYTSLQNKFQNVKIFLTAAGIDPTATESANEHSTFQPT